MPPAVTIAARRLDQIDAERFDAMLNSGSFALFTERIRADLLRAQSDCELQKDAVDLRRAQGRVTALRTVLDLPPRILKEITAKATR